MKILALDVSSTATGWAVMEPGPTLLEFGVFRPTAGRDAVGRIGLTAGAVCNLARCKNCQEVVMEWLDEHQHVSAQRIRSLITCARAQAAVYARLWLEDVVIVGESEWTRGKSKEARADAVALEFPLYGLYREAGNDKGLDAADAIGIAAWHLGKLREAELIGASEAERARRNARA